MPHSWHWVLLEEERRKKPGTSEEHGRYKLSFSEAPKPGELQERVSNKAETASNKAESKSMTMMLAGTPQTAISVESFQWAPKLLITL